MDVVKITMLGASRVGKSSLLAAMCDRFNDLIGETDLKIDLDTNDAAALQEQLVQLKSVGTTTFESTAAVGVEATQAVRTFKFAIGKKGKSASLAFEFADYPGEYLSAEAQQEDRKKVDELIRDCAAVVITIDAPAMMEAEGYWNEMFNRPVQITHMFKNAFKELDQPRLVLFAPVKCENYQDLASSEELRQAIKTTYKDLLEFFKSEEMKKNVIAVITPVQTIGTVVYSHMRVRDNLPHFFFQKIRHDAKYAPKDSEQPLRYLLRFFLKLHYNKRAKSWWIFSFLRDWLGLDEHLITAIQKFADGCKDENNSSEFEIIQGRQWL